MVYTIPTNEKDANLMGTTSQVGKINENNRETIRKTFSDLMMFGIILLVYIGVGALIFVRLEDEEDRSRTEATRLAVVEARRLFSNAILEITNGSSCSTFKVSYSTIDDKLSLLLQEYENILSSVVEDELSPYLSKFENVNGRWDYFHSLLFVFALITTIGYGNLTPRTIKGRLFCILFSLLGIPGALIVIHLAGKLLATIFMTLCGSFLKFKSDNSQISTRLEKLIGTSLAVFGVLCVLLFYNMLGAFLYNYTEGWGFVNSFYFCFTTLTTVGFGDLIPQAGVAAGNPFASIRILYVLFGLALTSTSFELVRTQYSNSWSKKKLSPRKSDAFFVAVQRIQNQNAQSAFFQKTSFHMEQSTQLVTLR